MDPWLRDRLAGVEARPARQRGRSAAPRESRRSRVDADRLLLTIERAARLRRRRRVLRLVAVVAVTAVVVTALASGILLALAGRV